MQKDANTFWYPSKPCYVGIHWIALTEYSQTSTHVPGTSFFLHHFVLVKLASSSIRVTTEYKWNKDTHSIKIKKEYFQDTLVACTYILNWSMLYGHLHLFIALLLFSTITTDHYLIHILWHSKWMAFVYRCAYKHSFIHYYHFNDQFKRY